MLAARRFRRAVAAVLSFALAATPALPPLVPAAAAQTALAPAAATRTAAAPSGLPPIAAAPAPLPALGDSDSADFTVATERKLGDEVMRQIRVDPDYLDDPLLLEYLQGLWEPLVVRARAQGHIPPDLDARFAWEAFLVRDPSVNAFALPGGFVGVHLGLMGITATRDELASVLAHELAHVTQRHIARGIVSQSRRSLVGLVAMVLGLIAASKSSSTDAMQAVIAGSQAAVAQGQLNFSRDVEREADRIGFQVLTGAGYAPSGMASMFEKMDVSTRLNDYGNYPYLRSHPLTVERIGEARARLGATPAGPQPSSFEHAAAQARARVLMDARTDALRKWQARDAVVEGTPAERFLAAMEGAQASSALRDWSRADRDFARAREILRAQPGEAGGRAERALALAQARSLIDRDAGAEALRTLAPWAADGSRPLLLLRADAALRSATPDGRELAARASDLATWVANHPLDALAWTALSQAWGKLGQPLRSLRADAESRYALGDLTGALDRLRAGQRAARGGGAASGGDFIDASVIDSRFRAIEAERKMAMADRQLTR